MIIEANKKLLKSTRHEDDDDIESLSAALMIGYKEIDTYRSYKLYL